MDIKNLANHLCSQVIPESTHSIIDEIHSLVFPIHITHIADMDGAGCLMLTGLVSSSNIPFILPPYGIGVGNNDIYSTVKKHFEDLLTKETFTELENTFLEKAKSKVVHLKLEEELPEEPLKGVRIIPWLIVTDVATHSNDIDLVVHEFKEKMDEMGLKSYVWLIDHHETNGFKMRASFEDCIDNVDICTKSFDMEDINHLLGRENDPKQTVFNLEDHFLLDKRDKSAIFIYYEILLQKGFIHFDERKRDIQLMKFVYMVSQGDTFAFDFPDKHSIWKSSYPRSYNSYFKYKNGGSNENEFIGFTNRFLRKIITELNSKGNDEYYGVHSTINETKYGPYFTEDDIQILDKIYNEELIKYKGAVSHAKYMEVNVGMDFFQDLEEQGKLNRCYEINSLISDLMMSSRLGYNLRYAVFCIENGEDVSMVGNTLVKQTDHIDIALFLYPESRTISLRSNNTKTIKCNEIAVNLGGGGHPFASGAKLPIHKFLAMMEIYWALPTLMSQEFIKEDVTKGIKTMEEM